MDTIRVFIADDHKMMREGLSLLLNNEPDIEVVGESFIWEEMQKEIRALKPDIVLLDTALTEDCEIQAKSGRKKAIPETKIIMMSNQNEDTCVHSALKDGARGFIVKQAASAEVALAIRQVADGYYYLSPIVQNRVIETYIEGTRTKPRGIRKEHNNYAGFNRLSEREKEVFNLLLEGHGSREISHFLNISSKTADKHRTSIFKKTGVENATQLFHYAIRLKLIPSSRAI